MTKAECQIYGTSEWLPAHEPFSWQRDESRNFPPSLREDPALIQRIVFPQVYHFYNDSEVIESTSEFV